MQISVFVFVLGLAGCLATEEPFNPDMTEDFSEMNKRLNSVDEDVKRSSSPSFEEIKRELEKHGILKNPLVIGLYPRGEEPADNDKRRSPVSNFTTRRPPVRRPTRPLVLYRPLCPEIDLPPLKYYIGYTATLVIKNIKCPKTKCAVCGHKYGACRLQNAYITLRTLYYNPFSIYGWSWYWKTHFVPACCQCYV